MTTKCISQLLQLLDVERESILSANFQQLDKDAEKKVRLFSLISESAPSTSELSILTAAVSRNQALLGAAIKGVSDARSRIEAILKAQSTLSTYNNSGQLESITNTKPALEKKA